MAASAIHRSRLSHLDIFQGLSPSELAEVESRLQLVTVARGEALVREGHPASRLFVVVSGRFRVWRAGESKHIAEIGPGQPIGEIAFFRGGVRTATVIAARDSVVVALTRQAFNDVAARLPQIWPALTAALAGRLAENNALSTSNQEAARPKTIAVCPAGSTQSTEAFQRNLAKVLKAGSKCIFISSASLRELAPAVASGVHSEAELTTFLNKLEESHEYVIYVADQASSAWNEKALRQADRIVWIADVSSGATDDVNQTEQSARETQSLGEQWLVLLHNEGRAPAGTFSWLSRRPWIKAHHHVAVDNASDYKRVVRFLEGTAVGLVACGGAAFSSAHIGTYEALQEAGIQFDILGGTSGGAALAAAFALGVQADDISRLIEDIFVSNKAMRRWTWPRYSLLDHAVLDRELARHYTDINIEDLRTPFFAVSTNVSRGTVHYHRTGSLWKAVRASGSIPALLPPVYTDDGDILVDGCLLDNLPVKGMRTFKSGPNILLDLETPSLDSYDVKYETIPGRGELLVKLITPFGRSGLPLAPSPQSILLSSLMINRRRIADELREDDLLLTLPIPTHFRHLDWREHRRLRQLGYDFTKAHLNSLRESGHPFFERL